MELEKFCPRCGEEVEKLYGDEKKLCRDCYPEKNTLLDIPEKVEIVVCPVCGRMRKKGDWIEEYSLEDQLAEKFAEFSRSDVEMELQFWEDEGIHVRVHASRDELEAFYDTEVEFDRQQCPECSKFEGGFYKVKMQLRGENLDSVADLVSERAAELTNRNRKDFVSNIDRTDHGYNFYLSTERMAKEILSVLRDFYDPDIKRSYEMIGEEDGQEVYRNVISVRIE